MTAKQIGIKLNSRFFPITEEMLYAAIAAAKAYATKSNCTISGVLATVGTQHVMMRLSKDGLIAGEKLLASEKNDGGDFKKTNPTITAAFKELHELLKKELSYIELSVRTKKAA